MTNVRLTKIAAAVAISGAFGVMGLGAGVASADPPWLQDRHGNGHDDRRGDDGWRWNGPGPRYWDPVQACVTAGGPFGYVQGSLCI